VKLRSALGSRTVAVASGALVLVAAAGGTALASGQVTSHDIVDGTIHAADLATGSVTSRVIKDGSVRGADIRDDSVSENDLRPGLRGKVDKPAYVGENWSVVDRNVIGNGDAFLRAGPSAAGGVAPPSGIGSLGLRTGAATDKAAFGDQVDFAGQLLSGIDTVSYYVFTTGENNGAAPGNLPSVAFEVNPHAAGSTFSTLVFSPAQATSNAWTKLDASTDQRWFYTGAFGTASGCNQTTFCTLAQAEAAAPDATLFTTQITKGRDFAFSGAVDDLQINDSVYDFEPNGVVQR
jgi:hypothetical protein